MKIVDKHTDVPIPLLSEALLLGNAKNCISEHCSANSVSHGIGQAKFRMRNTNEVIAQSSRTYQIRISTLLISTRMPRHSSISLQT